MNREIKFRIWDDTPIEDGFKGLMINHEYAIESSYLNDALKGKYPIMQYIGRKDKHNKEIYEEDIVRWDDMSKGEKWRVAVVELFPSLQFRIVKIKRILSCCYRHGNCSGSCASTVYSTSFGILLS